MTAPTRTSAYDQYADEYAAYVATREQDGLEGDPFGILPHLLAQLGDVTGQDVLDAGCGEGYLSRILAARGARVTGVDLSPRLVELAGHESRPRSDHLSRGRPERAASGARGPLRRRRELLRAERRRGPSRVRRDAGAARSGRAVGPCSGSTTRTTTSCARGTARPTSRPVAAHPCGLSTVGVPVFVLPSHAAASTWMRSWTPACA